MAERFNPETVERKILLDRFNWNVQLFPCVAASDYDSLLALYRGLKEIINPPSNWDDWLKDGPPLTVRAYNTLAMHHPTKEEFSRMELRDFWKTKNCGIKTVIELAEWAFSQGIRLSYPKRLYNASATQHSHLREITRAPNTI
jgi:hypothetical protein